MCVCVFLFTSKSLLIWGLWRLSHALEQFLLLQNIWLLIPESIWWLTSVAQVPGNPMLSSGLHRHKERTWCTAMHASKHLHIKLKTYSLKDPNTHGIMSDWCPMSLLCLGHKWVYCVCVYCVSGEMQHCHSLILMLNRTVFQMCVLTKPIYSSTIFNE